MLRAKYVPAAIAGLKNKLATKSDTAADLMGFTSWVRVEEIDQKIKRQFYNVSLGDKCCK